MFTLNVVNTAPYFLTSLVDQQMNAGETMTYVFPQKKDDEGGNLTVTSTLLG